MKRFICKKCVQHMCTFSSENFTVKELAGCLARNSVTVHVEIFAVYKFSWTSWYPLIHENLYTTKINT